MKLKQARDRADKLKAELGYPHIVWVDHAARKILVCPMGKGNPGPEHEAHYSNEEVGNGNSDT